MTQEFHISVTPIGADEYLVRTELVAPGVPLAEEQVVWPVDEWLERAKILMKDPLTGLLRSDAIQIPDLSTPLIENSPEAQHSLNLTLFGQQLYNALFQGTLRDSWMTAQGIAQHRQDVLRLRLGLKDHRLPRLPWEVLHTGDRPIAARTDLVFSRYQSSFAVMSSPFQQMPVVEPGQPLKILLVLAAPTDQEILALKQEALHLQQELEAPLQNGGRNSPGIQITILEQPGREQLTQALEHSHYQVLHYAGHSNLGTSGGKLYLVNSKTGLTETLNGDDLAGLLVNNGIRMAVFNSCRGGYTAADGSEAGEGNLVEALVKRGIPSVLAMAERIPDDVALNLSRLFYRNLRQLYPIDLSLNRARQGLLSSYGSNHMYWALPILYLHPKFDGHLLIASEEEAEAVSIEPESLADAAWDDEAEAPPAKALIDDSDYLPEDWDELESPSLSDPADLEFDNPEYQPELETVAQLVNQLSQSSSRLEVEAPLAASPTESLLPDTSEELKPEDYIVLPDNPRYAAAKSAVANSDRTEAESIVPEPVAIAADSPNSVDASVYLELERLLAESGKPTHLIAACNRAIQAQPDNPEPFDRLGQALAQQGYLAEAISAYQQAIRLKPSHAEAHHHLGQALFQQGNVRESIRAYSRALQISPQLTEVRQSMETALHRQGVQLPPEQKLQPAQPQATGEKWTTSSTPQRFEGLVKPSAKPPVATAHPSTPEYKPTTLSKPVVISRRRLPKPLLWLGAGVAGASIMVVSVGFLHDRVGALIDLPVVGQSIPIDLLNSKDLKQANTPVVTAVATKQLSQGNIGDAQRAIEVLLDRGALSQAATALTPALDKQSDNATINFLMGRLAWQFLRSGNTLYKVSDARRSWEKASEKQSTALYQNALGFAYYAEGNLDRASEAWLRSLQLSGAGEPTTSPGATRPATSQDTLTAYAGLSMVLMQKAEKEPAAKRNSALNRAVELRQKVFTEDPIRFQPNALAQNWLWSEQAIKDWKKLLSLK